MKSYEIRIDRAIVNRWLVGDIYDTLREKTGRYGELKTDLGVYNLSDDSTDDIIIIGSYDDDETFRELIRTISDIIWRNYKPRSPYNYSHKESMVVDDGLKTLVYYTFMTLPFKRLEPMAYAEQDNAWLYVSI